MFENKEKTEISKLGEFGLINHLTKNFPISNSNTSLGIGDDAAVVSNGERSTVVSTDMLIENIDFDVMYSPLKHIGYKSVVSSVSDIYAMNATAEQLLISIAISSKFPLEAIEEIYAGIKAACEKYKIDLIGGDTSSSVTGLLLTITAIGSQKQESIVQRSGAKEGDLVCVTGDLGGAYMGLQILEREKRVFLEQKNMQPDLEGKDYIIGRQLRPEARKDIIESFEEHSILPTSMIDVSDGLASELFHICQKSEIGVKIYEEKIPIDPQTYDTALEFNLDPTLCAMNGGDDYELLFTIPQKEYDKIKNSQDISIIGYCTAPHEGKTLITKSGNVVELKAQGWQHLEVKDNSSKDNS